MPCGSSVTRPRGARSNFDFAASKSCQVLFNACVQLSEQGLTFPINSEHVYMYIFNFNHLLFKRRSSLPASKSGLCLSSSSVSGGRRRMGRTLET